MYMTSYKKEVKNLYPNAECVWRDGARILYEIFDGKKPLTDQYSLSPKAAWRNAFLKLRQ